jgi:hypothetical protein
LTEPVQTTQAPQLPLWFVPVAVVALYALYVWSSQAPLLPMSA